MKKPNGCQSNWRKALCCVIEWLYLQRIRCQSYQPVYDDWDWDDLCRSVGKLKAENDALNRSAPMIDYLALTNAGYSIAPTAAGGNFRAVTPRLSVTVCATAEEAWQACWEDYCNRST